MSGREAPRSTAGRWVELGAGVFARRYAELDLTVGVVLGADACMVVDTRGDAVQGAELADAVAEYSDEPPTIVYTHAHFDHCFGTSAFKPRAVLGHVRCRADLAMTAEAQRAIWVAHYERRGEHGTARNIAEALIVLPTPVDEHSTVDLGGREVRLVHLGLGHTDHDLVVQVPDAGVVFAGDLLEHGAPPAFDDAHPLAWPGTLGALLDLGAHTMVPGHGEVMDTGAVLAQRDDLAAVAALCRGYADGTITEADALARSPYPDAVTRIALARVGSAT